MPDFMRGVAQHKPLYFAIPTPIRPWQHVLEPLVGLPAARRKTLGTAARVRARLEFRPGAGRYSAGALDRGTTEHYSGNQCVWEIDTGPQPHEAGLC